MADSARSLLGPDGPLARSMPGYEVREGQLAMADAVERALDGASVLLCEAGTGTGKTLAYLVPALLSGQRVVISTATKALEEQIVHHDVALVRERIGLNVEVVLAKGLANYVCLRRFGEARTDAGVRHEHRRALPLVEAWVKETASGDIAELGSIAEDDPVWGLVTSSSETRIGSGCPHYDACFVTRMKRSLTRARVIVVSHHLFFADLAVKAQAGEGGVGRAGVLPPYEAVIFDEAHKVEDVVSDFFGVRLSTAKIGTVLRDTERAIARAGLGDRLLVQGDGIALVRRVDASSRSFFAAVQEHAGPSEGRSPLAREVLERAIAGPFADLDADLEALEHFAELHATSDGMDVAARRLAALRAEARRIVDPATHDVVWVEVKGRSIVVGASVVSVGRVLRERVFERVGGVVLTSATLTSVPVAAGEDEDQPPGPFSFLRRRLGVDAGLRVPVEELAVGSPFDYARAAILYVARDLPEPAGDGFLGAAADRILELCAITGGGAFVLTTSLRAMRGLGARVRASGTHEVMVQGEAPKSALIERFRAHGSAVLVATMGFWEGVDVPGDALRLVIIEKLPFAVPSDPVFAARARVLEQEGVDPFMGYAVPDAAIAMKQGVGRLLRTESDRGIVAVLDRRLVAKSYGRKILDRLPPLSRTEVLDDARAFWAAVRAPS